VRLSQQMTASTRHLINRLDTHTRLNGGTLRLHAPSGNLTGTCGISGLVLLTQYDAESERPISAY
jgi:hypothetical protein